MSIDYSYKYIIIGNSGVGKSCILLSFTDKRFQYEHDLTIGIEFGSRIINLDDKKVKVMVFDTAGQECFKSITRSYYKGSAGALLVYDITNRTSFDCIEKWLSEIQEYSGNQMMVIMLIGNKNDLEHRRRVSKEEGEQLAKKYNILFSETSAKLINNIDDVFIETAKIISERVENKSIDTDNKNFGITDFITNKKKLEESLVLKNTSCIKKIRTCCG